MEIFYFAPHQDDELTNLGPAVCRDLTLGHGVHVVLCTDGAASGVKRMLADGGGCAWHTGAHRYALSAEAFTAARDREFLESCACLGVAAENARISPLRGPDGGLTRAQAERIILEALSGFPPAECAVKTLAPLPGVGQNPDHTALGLAAQALFRAGAFASLTLTHEFIHLPPVPSLAGNVIRPAPQELERIKKAAAAYSLWAPAAGRYAVGFHSVADEFRAFLADPVCVETV